ncbi:heavy-metal-associated domain-containing protein [uncultured Microbacterium sp.]|uniref:heavy-metal-associated domain-containing protein n=1 Tax=uncultured Microbacterium sp. TaxID=191216 RepID=UPI0028ED40A8|nr:heavy-metal-associated domain-containing protein [uncultured Microbacterium sp.]
MNTASRLGLYGAGLVVVFGVAFAVAGAVVPDSAVASWTERGGDGHDEQSAEPGTQNTDNGKEQGTDVSGVMIAASGYTIGAISAPGETGTAGELSFVVRGPEGEPVTSYETAHGKQLHLIVVRSDGSRYRHVHPVLDIGTGAWSLPWTWEAAGTYRVYADFTASDGPGVTLSRTVDVGGPFTPQPPAETRSTATVDGFDVSISGDLVAGAGSELTVEVARDGVPVTALEPYLGAFGHLVALRDGDLAYLHVHAHGDEPEPGEVAGPEVVFTAQAPTAGRYLLYLDFQVDGKVHTAPFVLDAVPADLSSNDTGDDHGGH